LLIDGREGRGIEESGGGSVMPKVIDMEVPEISDLNGVVQILEEAREIILPVGRWTQVYMARAGGVRGRSVHSSDKDADCWCAIGAITKACSELGLAPSARVGAEVVFQNQLPAEKTGDGRHYHMSIAQWNDVKNRRKGEVIAKFDAAIKVARELAGAGVSA